MRSAWFPVALTASLLAGGASPCPAGEPAKLLNASQDRVVRTAPVPSAVFPQAEVRLVRRDGAAVVQTVIVSTLAKRVVAVIRKKEAALWPPGRPGHEDSARYAEALERAYRAVERRFREDDSRRNHRRKLLIEFVLSEKEAFVALLEPEVQGDLGGIRVLKRRVLEVLPLSRRYTEEDMREIAMDSLGMTRREAEEALKPLPRPALQPEADPQHTGDEAEKGGAPR